ncbi:hypothetical protein [Microbulbifer sp. THAF38]|uniref:hypothetical protein n=1 Tax=Microbulbifer sp. THAF38 TaxID=2587856 RepID=UPI00126968A2|nr:hypothetical protein [Microbulbifer sp. THAF38]QFT55386.1 hypothetical protein FIU95_12550 [Microbulbifer sp. THAF38]
MKNSRKIIFGLLLTFIAFGVLEAFFPGESNGLGLFHGLVILSFLFWWIGVHASENGIIAPKGSKILTLLVPPLGLPYYFYKGYGFKKGSILVAVALLLFVLALGMYILGFGAANQLNT